VEDCPTLTHPRSALRATLAGDGRPGPIEERFGRRLLRLVDPDSAEGIKLLQDQRVELIAPGGEQMGCISLEEALDRLIQRLEELLSNPEVDSEPLQEGLARLRARCERISRS